MTKKNSKLTPEDIETNHIMDRITLNIEELKKISNITIEELKKPIEDINYRLIFSNIIKIDNLSSKNHEICTELTHSQKRSECFDYVLDFNNKIENSIINAVKLRMI
jgi:hypothetical protein